MGEDKSRLGVGGRTFVESAAEALRNVSAHTQIGRASCRERV